MEDLVVRALIPSRNLLIVHVAHAGQTVFIYALATLLMNKGDMERAKCIVEIFFCRNRYVSVDMKLVDTIPFQNKVCNSFVLGLYL